jgi:hypothetical protein
LKGDATEKYVPLINRLLLRVGIKGINNTDIVGKVLFASLIYY